MWQTCYEDKEVRVLVSSELPNEVRILFATLGGWHEVYCGSKTRLWRWKRAIDVLVNSRKKYA